MVCYQPHLTMVCKQPPRNILGSKPRILRGGCLLNKINKIKNVQAIECLK